jgi:hypothetical protein
MPDHGELAKIKANLSVARDLELRIKDTEQKLKDAKADLEHLVHKVIPEQFNAAGIKNLTLEANGNQPAMSAQLRPYFKAVIPVKWDDIKRQEALVELDKYGAGDLARKTVSVAFPRSESDEADEFARNIGKMGYSYVMQFDIPWQTLTAWLRETVNAGEMPNLDKIGGQVGQVINLKAVDE